MTRFWATDLVRSTYDALEREVREAGHTPDELALLSDPVNYYGRFLDPKDRAYSMAAVERNIVRALEFLGPGTGRTLLDIGCGLGMNAIVFARAGYSVVGVDISKLAVGFARKRVAWWSANGASLDVTVIEANFLALDLPTRFDAVFSMSAFAHICPVEAATDRLASFLAMNGRAFLWDQSPWRHTAAVPHWTRMADSLRDAGLSPRVRSGTVFHRLCWRIAPARPLLRLAENVLAWSPRAGFTYAIEAVRK